MIGQHVAHYQILEKIGEGGMGLVYRARDTRLDREVALKFLSLDLTGSAELKRRFIQEAKAASALDHPNICTIYAIDETDDGRLFIAMGYYDGETLKSKLGHGPLPWPVIVDVAWQAASGLQAAHERGIVHLDVKPANLMLTRAGTVKILDFGLSRFTSEIDRKRREGPLMGTVGYLSPERVQGDKTGPESDIWALGVVLYEMATGTRPFAGANDMSLLYAIVHREITPPRERVPDLPIALDRVIRRSLVKDRRRRYQSFADFLGDLEPLHQSSSSVTLPRLPRPDWQRRRRPRLAGRWIAAALAVALVAGLLSWMLVRRARIQREMLPESRGVLLLELRNRSQKSGTEWLGPAVAELLLSELSQDGEVRWIREHDPAPSELLAGASRFRPDHGFGGILLTRIRHRLKAARVVGGSYRVAGEEAPEIEVALLVQDTENGETVASVRDRGRPTALPALAGRLAATLAPALGVPALPRPEGEEERRLSLPVGPGAAPLLARAREALRVLDARQALELLRRALRVEPDNAFLRLTLAEALWQLGREEEAQKEAAAAFALRRDLNRRAQIYLEARHLEMQGAPGRAALLLRALWAGEFAAETTDPAALDRALHLALVLVKANQSDAALALVETLRPLLPADPRIPLAETEASRGRSRGRQQRAAARAVELARQSGAPFLQARALLLEGEAWRWQGEPRKAEARLRAAQEIYAREGHEPGEADMLMILGNLQWDEQDLPGAKASYERAARLYGSIGSPRKQARALINQGVVLADRGDLEAAIEISRRVIAVFEETGDQDGLLIARVNLAELYLDTGQLELAREVLARASELAETMRTPSFEAVTLRTLGRLLILQGDLTAAHHRLNRALEIQRGQTGDRMNNAETLYYLSQVFHYQGDLEEALARQQEALELFLKSGNQTLYARSCSARGEILMQRGDLEAARASFAEALAIQTTLSDPHQAARTRLPLARLLIELGQPEAAESQAREVLAGLSPSHAVLELARAHGVLAESLLAQRQPSRARHEITAARALLGDIESPLYRLPLGIAASRVEAAHGAEEAAAQSGRLQALLATATAHGLHGLELEIELALGEIELQAGSEQAARARLVQVAETARSKGHGLIAEKARQAAHRGAGIDRGNAGEASQKDIAIDESLHR